MQKLVLVLVVAAAATGCTTVQKVALDTGAGAAMKGQTLVQTTRSMPDLAAMSATKGAFGMLGALAAVSEGNELVKKNQVQDPAVAIGAALAQRLQAGRDVQLVAPAVPVDSTEPGKLAAAAKGKASYVLDVQTINWMFAYFPTDWSHYRVQYSAQVRLVNVQTGALLAQGTCSFFPQSSEGAPTYDELVNNQAAGLKTHMQRIANECAGKIQAEMLVL